MTLNFTEAALCLALTLRHVLPQRCAWISKR